jgi:hypothetical protein
VRGGYGAARTATEVINMTQYLLALYRDYDAPIPPDGVEQKWNDVGALIDKMKDAGVFVFKEGMRGGPEAATVVRQSGADFLITDGPYTETKEHLAGFWIVNVSDLDAALEWAKLAAAVERRAIEVRPFFGGDLDDAIQDAVSSGQ